MRTNLLTVLPLLLLGSPLIAQNKSDDLIGIWLNPGKEPAKIQIYKNGEKYFGKIIWLKFPLDKEGKSKTDFRNPDKDKRSNLVIGLVILTAFIFDGEDEWEGGEIYDPETGNTYSSTLSFKDKNTLKVRGYIGISLFGRTEIWTRSN
jgi:uncharacterized protein (DUF2147 family)